ncbi:MAG: hypothetical protein WBB01_16475 [Phormidesmis sp.]
MIFAQGRTGSTLLENLLCSTGYFSENGEVLNTIYGEIAFPLSFISGLSKRYPSNFIFHVKTYQLTQDRKKPIDPGTFLETLYADGWKIIYLRRENKIKQALSNIIANHRGKYHKLDQKEENLKILFSCEKLIKKVKKRLAYGEEEKAALANVTYHEVAYESDLENAQAHQKTVDRILEYLSLALEPRLPSIEKSTVVR